jgi:hypothetical protein
MLAMLGPGFNPWSANKTLHATAKDWHSQGNTYIIFFKLLVLCRRTRINLFVTRILLVRSNPASAPWKNKEVERNSTSQAHGKSSEEDGRLRIIIRQVITYLYPNHY